jgi:mRNA-degrading endonuclease RelE of RelBE toxin-antitoxin system
MRLLVTPSFVRATKRLHAPQKPELDAALRTISADPSVGDAKVGDLAGIRVYKFRISNQLCLLGYRILDEQSLKLLTLGSHENFYRDLKRLDD